MRLFKFSKRSLVCLSLTAILSAGSAMALTLDEVPKPVKKTIEKEAEGATILSITESTDGDGRKLFSATVAENGGEKVIVMGEHGRIIRRAHRAKLVREAKREAHEVKKEEKEAKEAKKEKKGEEKGTKKPSTPTTETPAAPAAPAAGAKGK